MNFFCILHQLQAEEHTLMEDLRLVRLERKEMRQKQDIIQSEVKQVDQLEQEYDIIIFIGRYNTQI